MCVKMYNERLNSLSVAKFYKMGYISHNTYAWTKDIINPLEVGMARLLDPPRRERQLLSSGPRP